ncbi:hypothetical protein ACLVWU_15480 [Bdellovibrio sp. HCB290]|uniref:hypothetical protein n=1 Tax=Bdellovibrio sp. HCB290 TaxID=3394356 RepID=UPI0039B39A7D
MKSLMLALGVLVSTTMAFASPVEVSVGKSVRWTVPAQGYSCFSKRMAAQEGKTATPDVEGAYFTVPKMTFQIADSSRHTYINAIKIFYKTPRGGEKSCVFGGDQLAALSDFWWKNENKQALIRANPTSGRELETHCPVSCGGVEFDSGEFKAPATVRVYGYTQSQTNEDDQEGFVATTHFEFGSQY